MLMAAGAALHGVTLTDTARLRFKESDRGAVMAEELAKCGIRTELTEHTIVVHSGGLVSPCETLSGHNDHRIVMALTVLLSRVGGQIDEAESVNKSYPTFFTDMAGIGIECKNV
jgi:3-phosphoshikimate 1-carboxyvinyltransferase